MHTPNNLLRFDLHVALSRTTSALIRMNVKNHPNSVIYSLLKMIKQGKVVNKMVIKYKRLTTLKVNTNWKKRKLSQLKQREDTHFSL